VRARHLADQLQQRRAAAQLGGLDAVEPDEVAVAAEVEIEALCRRAGAPDGVFQTLLIGSDAVASVLADPRVAAATLTDA